MQLAALISWAAQVWSGRCDRRASSLSLMSMQEPVVLHSVEVCDSEKYEE
jgi:hypothetical protein